MSLNPGLYVLYGKFQGGLDKPTSFYQPTRLDVVWDLMNTATHPQVVSGIEDLLGAGSWFEQLAELRRRPCQVPILLQTWNLLVVAAFPQTHVLRYQDGKLGPVGFATYGKALGVLAEDFGIQTRPPDMEACLDDARLACRTGYIDAALDYTQTLTQGEGSAFYQRWVALRSAPS